MELEQAPVLSCTIQIDGLERRTWQGRVLAEGEEVSFHSELELLLTMEKLLEKIDGRRGPPFPGFQPSCKKEETR